MLSEDGSHFECEGSGCDQTVKNHRWGKTKAVGWLFLKNGKSFCPKHVPAWAENWKGKNG